MDILQEIALEYTNLLDKNFIYKLENHTKIQLYFTTKNFYHLAGLHKLTDIAPLIKASNNSLTYIFKNILNGFITYDDIKKSKYFGEIEPRLKHFKEINKIVEFQKVIIDFDVSLINSKIEKSNYILFKRSNDNMYLNLFLLTSKKDLSTQTPNTFIPHMTDYYTNGQKQIKIISVFQVDRKSKNKIKK